MRDARLPRKIFAVIVFVTLAKATYDYPLLPERMASHFGAGGFPNGWMGKGAFFVVFAVLVLFSTVMVFLAPRLIAASSDERIHLPRKEYWLAPERRAETMAYFTLQFAWYGCGFLLTEVLAMEMAIQANFQAPPHLATGPILLVVAGFVLFNAFWAIALVRHFAAKTAV
jgi:uncharacterized membrane protein